MTGLATDWTTRAARLADTLIDRGDLRTDAWRDAVAAVPRHILVPAIYHQDDNGEWFNVDTRTPEGLDLIYSAETLITALDERGYPVSSSTKPDLMIRMLELLNIHGGHKVLEIGTGTGYNAALLAHRLGDQNVYSLDVDPALVNLARERLFAIGYHPNLASADGELGWPAHAPFDRIVATCSVPRVPWAWAQQLVLGGRALVDLKLAVGAGNLVDLHRYPDRLEGHFTTRWAAFMAMRHDRDPVAQQRQQQPSATETRQRSSTAPPQPWANQRIVWFLAQFYLPSGVTFGMQLHPDTGQPTASTLTSPDGSWSVVSLDDHDGCRDVTERGVTSLWAAVEQAHAQWTELGQPAWERLGLTVTQDKQWVWLDRPDKRIVTLP